jgi:dephospho-CoA kinase
MPDAAMFILSGGMCAGKTTAGREYDRLGAHVIDADNVVRDLRRPGEPGYIAMVDILGEGIIASDETLDTEKISAIIFSEDELRGRVQRVLHPLVWERMFSEAAELNAEDVAIFEVPLPDKEMSTLVNGVVALIAPVELALEHLINGDRDVTPEEALRRIKSQPTNEERVAAADYVITNDGTEEELKTKVGESLTWMKERAHLL